MKGLTVKETAKELCVSIEYITRLCHLGKLPHLRLGRRIIIDRSDLDKWIEKHKVGNIE